MKQLIQNVSTGRSAVVEVPAPQVGHGELLVRVAASLISAGTEKMVVEFAEKNLLQKALARPDLVRQVLDKAKRDGIFSAFGAVRTRLDSDIALGYSVAGTVIDVGPGVSGFQVGDRVACAGGGYASHAEIVRVPVNLVAKVPAPLEGRPVIDFEEVAFTTVGAIALQGIRLARLQLGETVGVIGLGLIGLLTAELASAAGCHVVGMDVLEDRCLLARKLGCAATARTTEEMREQVFAQSSGVGADAVIICASTSSNGPLQLAGEVARERARVVAVGAVGLDIPRKIYYEKELSVYVSRSYGPGRYDPEYEEKGRDYPIAYVRWTENRNMQAFLGFLADGRLSVRPLVTHRFPIAQAAEAYELIGGGRDEPFVGVILTYPPAAGLERRVELKTELVAQHQPAAKVTVGMIGAGNFATAVLLPVLRADQDVELEGLATVSGASARAAASRFGFRYCASDHQELLRDPAINTIVIATRHHLHSRQIIGALETGKHVFCEKPLCISREELAGIIQAYQHASSTASAPILMVGFNRRFAPLAMRLREFVRSVGEPLVMNYRVNAGFLPPTHWTQDIEQGGGRIIGELCHFIDFLVGLIGKQATSVHASALPNGGRYCDDNLIATLEFQDGSVGTITYVANGDKSFAKERLEVFGGSSVAVLDDFRCLMLIHGGRRQRVFKWRLRQDKGHRDEWESFSKAIRAGGPAPIPFGELVNTTLTSLEILKALRSRERRVVDAQSFLTDCAPSHF